MGVARINNAGLVKLTPQTHYFQAGAAHKVKIQISAINGVHWTLCGNCCHDKLQN